MNRTLVTTIAISMALVLGNNVVRAGGDAPDLQVRLSTRPEHIEKGMAVSLTIDVRDRANKKVDDLPIVHERPIHLIIVPADLSHLVHLHPEKVARGL